MKHKSLHNKLKNLCLWIFAHIFKYFKRIINVVLLVIFTISIIIFLLRWALLCSDNQLQQYIENVCSTYANAQATGNLCDILCKPGEVTFNCHNFYHNKETIFSGKWQNNTVLFKSPKKTSNGFFNSDLHFETNLREDNLIDAIQSAVKSRFNMSINEIDARKMLYTINNHNRPNEKMVIEKNFALLQDNEYLALNLYNTFDIFPKLVGTCGSLYGVQKLNSLQGFWQLMTLYDNHEEWKKRIGLAINIMNYINQIERDVPEPLILCNIKIMHFGVSTYTGKIKYLDLDSVHPISVANKLAASGKHCTKHSDCDVIDCRSFCNLVTSKCQYGVVNDNVQLICERVFLGWAMAGRVMVPGLLLSSWTPRVLVELLERCANPHNDVGVPRARTSKEVRGRLYDLLISLKKYYE